MYRSKLIPITALAVAATAVQVAGAAGSPRGLTAAASQGGVSMTPSILETTARRGARTSTTISNTTNRTLRVTVTPRPWKQTRDGVVIANRRRKLGGVALSAKRFTLAPGARREVQATLARVPSRGSLFGALEVVGKPTKRRRGINVAYRLVSSLRFSPAASARRYALRAGKVSVRSRALRLAVRNRGNTVDAVGGTVSITGPGAGRSATITPARILPGKRVRVRAASLAGLRRGSYRARFALTQAGRTRVTVTKSFRVP